MKLFCIILSLFLASNTLLAQTIKQDTIFIEKTEVYSIYYEPNINSEQAKQLIKAESKYNYIELQRYKEKYCLYAPCDWINYKSISIKKDSVFVDFGEMNSYGIIKKQKNRKEKMTLYDLQNQFGTRAYLVIKKIKIEKGSSVAIIKFYLQETKVTPFYLLMVRTAKAKRYPIIVNNCPYNKGNELKFDRIDLENWFNK